jgi:D-sedoheptulose 7-phosphate isomerase
MNEKTWLSDYYQSYKKLIDQPAVYDQLIELKAMILNAHRSGKKTIFAGNGGSAAVASHAAVDFTKCAGVRAINFNESDLITCLANDYGYENWVQKAIEFYADPGDVVVLISSSGKSPNIVNAAQFARSKGLALATFTGFAADNPLRSLGGLSLWVDSTSYNIVENTHLIWILTVCDLIIKDAETPHPEKVLVGR